MAFPKKLKELCTPAFLYFSLAMLGVLVSVVQNLGNSRRYNLGMLSTSVPSTFLVFVVKIIYILFWTWVLNLMCKDGHKEIAWFLVLIPFILLFLIMGSMMGGSSYEGFYQAPAPAAAPKPPAAAAPQPGPAGGAPGGAAPTVGMFGGGAGGQGGAGMFGGTDAGHQGAGAPKFGAAKPAPELNQKALPLK